MGSECSICQITQSLRSLQMSRPYFLFYCDHYNEIRESLCSEITYKCENFAQLNDKQKLNLLMSNQYVYDFSKFVRKCYLKRRETTYSFVYSIHIFFIICFISSDLTCHKPYIVYKYVATIHT